MVPECTKEKPKPKRKERVSKVMELQGLSGNQQNQKTGCVIRCWDEDGNGEPALVMTFLKKINNRIKRRVFKLKIEM